MTFTPVDLMLDRVRSYGSDSDTTLFTELLYAGEFVLKLTTSAFIAAVEDDRERHRYRVIHALVRADGVGEWVKALDEVLIGATTQHLSMALSDPRRIFTERLGRGNWQYEVVHSLQDLLIRVNDGAQPINERVSLRLWFQIFAELRNKTRGHGAPTPARCAELAPKLDAAIRLFCANNPIFQLPWAFLHRNLSGKYKVVGLGGDQNAFASLKAAGSVGGENYPDGVYLWADKCRPVELVHSDLDLRDFFVPNGAFRNGTYELHSLITDSRLRGDATPYLLPASERPPSETEGRGELDVLGRVWTNLPTLARGYVRRPQLEADLRAALMNDRHPIVTLVGRGGIGKTSLALAILRDLAELDRYDVIVWFSARDIDLMMSGAKAVRPRVLTDRDIADQYRSLIGSPDQKSAGKLDVTAFMANHLCSSPLGPTLFVFDNFETVRSPVDLFQWIDTNIRLPNKALITTRFRDFKADYPVEVSGMMQVEAESLVMQTAQSLGIGTLIGRKERDELVDDSDGHPYVIKIILGEIANTRKFSKPANLFARKDDILDALFERTYANLSPMAARIFLTLSGWRSLVPQLAVEAVALRYSDTNGASEVGIDQLLRMSLIERKAAGDNNAFLEVPLTAALFGRRKLAVSPNRAVIESDIKFLQEIGATTASALKDGIRPRVETYFKRAARTISEGSVALDELRPVLEFFCRGYPPAWLLLSELEQEAAGQQGMPKAAECVRRYLEADPEGVQAPAAWRRLWALYRGAGDVIGGCGAFLKAADFVDPPLFEISSMANWLNTASELKDDMDVVERRALFKPMASLMERHLDEASATDLSRVAWLHLHCGETTRALEVAGRGLRIEPDNIHCQRLVTKITYTG